MEQTVNSISPPPVVRFRKTSGRRRDGLWLDTRTPGKPVWCIRYKGLDGKQHRERTEAQTREQALALLHQRTTEILKARIVGLPTLERLKPSTFSEFVDKEYLPAKAPPARRSNTHDRDKNLYAILKPTFGSLTLGAIDVQELNRYFARRKNGKTYKGTAPSPAQLNRERQFLHAVLGMALQSGLIDRNPVQCIKKLREDNARDRVLSLDEETEILKKAPVFLKPIFTFALHTGMRLGEIVNLRWSDVERREGNAVLGGFIRVGHESKGHKSRHVPINASVKALLDAQTPVSSEDGFVPFVFVNERFKQPYRASSIYNAFKGAAQRANVEGVVFHTTRHTAVSRMVAAGTPDRIIMKIVGHSSPHMVSRYSHLAPDNLKGATDCLMMGSDRAERTRSVQTSGTGK